MNGGPDKRTAPTSPVQGDSARFPVVIVILIAGLALIGVLIVFHKKRAEISPESPSANETATSSANDSLLSERGASLPKLPPLPAYNPAPAVIQDETVKPGLSAHSSIGVARPEPSAFTRNLIQHLSELPATPEQAAIWKQNYATLVHEGAAAIPAIRELLEKKSDVQLPTDQIGYPSLRMAMFAAMQQIGGQDAIDLALDTMRSPYQPTEIAMMASQLESMAPGQYNDAIFSAADTALRAASQSPNVDLSSLFQVLQKYGGAGAAIDLQSAATKWNYYGPIALASLPDGGGVSALTAIAQNSDGSYANSRNFSFQMLAQLAPQNQDAAQALLNFISNNQVPAGAWRGIVAALSGDQMSYSGATPPAGVTNPKSSHIAANDQNFSSWNYAAIWTPQQRQNQLALIDRLMAVNPQAQSQLAAMRAALAAGQ